MLTPTHILCEKLPLSSQVRHSAAGLQFAQSSLNAGCRRAVRHSVLAVDMTSSFLVRHCSQNYMHIKKSCGFAGPTLATLPHAAHQ